MIGLGSVLLMASSLCCAAAQSSGTSSESTSTALDPTASSTPTVHRVDVGAGSGSHAYSPNVLNASVGDTVMFVFYPTNHSVIRGEYTGSDACGKGSIVQSHIKHCGCNPCVPYSMIHQGGGFNSANMLTQQLPSPNSVSSDTLTFNITVNSTDPIWYYCNAIDSCHPNGMVGVINPANGQNITTQKTAAINAPYQLAPDDNWPAEGAPVGAETATVSGYSEPTSTALNGTPTATSQPSSNSHSSHLSGGAIAGIVIGGVAVLLLAAALFYFVGRSKAYKDAFHGKSETAASNTDKKEAVSQWVAPPPPAGDPQSSTSGYTDNRFSYQTHPHMAQHNGSEAQFLGYNRQTGAPEFASEVPSHGGHHPGHQSWMSHTTVQGPSPLLNQNDFQPLSGSQRYEMSGDVPARAEKP